MMKKIAILLVLIPFAALQSLAASQKQIHIAVKGMVCAFCAQGITKKFSAQPSVEKVNVDLGKKQVDLLLKDGKDLSDSAITGILTDAGYNVGKIDRN